MNAGLTTYGANKITAEFNFPELANQPPSEVSLADSLQDVADDDDEPLEPEEKPGKKAKSRYSLIERQMVGIT